MDRRPQPEAGGGDERAEGERGAHAVAPRPYQLLPGARHRERVRAGQAVPGPVPQGPRSHRRVARSHVHLRGNQDPLFICSCATAHMPRRR